jgi:phage gpG-like protein
MAGGIRAVGGGFSIDIQPPLGRLEETFTRLLGGVEDLTPLWEAFWPILSHAEQDRFDSEGFGEWPPLAESTIREKERLGYPDTPLLRTGDLRDSLIDPAQAVHDATARSFTWGSDVDYAVYHQDGGSVEGRPPQRTVLDISVDIRQELEGALLGFMEELYRSSMPVAA